MKKYHRDNIQREKDLLRTAELNLHGKLQSEIAEEIGVTQQQISKDLKELRKRWLNKSVEKIDQKKAEELAKIDQLERTYWDAWRKSTEYKTGKAKVGGRDVTVLVPADKSKPYGAKGFLDSIQWCITRRRAILGIDAPKQIGTDLNFREYVVEFK
jgi:hypothetical protein